MLITKTVEMKWSNKIKKYYVEKGYKFTKKGDIFKVKVEDLPQKSDKKIQYICDYCLEEGYNNIVTVQWRSYIAHKKYIINKDACPKHSIKKEIEMGLDLFPKKVNRYSKEEIKNKYLNLYQQMNLVPKTKDIIKESKRNTNFPTIQEIRNQFGTLGNLKKYCNINTINFKYSKEYLLKQLKEYINKNGISNLKTESFKRVNGLHSYDVYMNYFGKNLANMIELCGFKLSEKEKYELNKRGKANNLTKDEVSKIIYDMQSKLNRPLMYDDFRNPKNGEVGIRIVRKYWGTMNNMKKELELTINQEDMITKHKTFEESKKDIIKLCNYIYSTENRKVILSTDTNKIDGLLNFDTYRAYFKENNLEIRDFISSLGFELQKGGVGLNYTFNDGEKTTSKYEYAFSRYLKNELKLQYNRDYFRDVRYNTFIKNYNELMDCDYIIHYQGRTIYIEIAGMLRDLHNYYYNDEIIIQSKTKENYRQKLMKKEEMLKSINVEYYILFPINKNYQSVLDWDLINRIFN